MSSECSLMSQKVKKSNTRHQFDYTPHFKKMKTQKMQPPAWQRLYFGKMFFEAKKVKLYLENSQ